MPAPARLAAIATALALAALVAATEYFFRHYVLFWMPTIGSLRVNDMLALALAYSGLAFAAGVAVKIRWREEWRGLAEAFREILTRWTYVPWLLAIMAGLVVLPFVDRWLVAAAPALEAVTAIGVNGMLVPVSEEWLWRGLIQRRLARSFPAWAAIAVTAVAFSLKHVLVDASWGRFLTLVAFGVVCGIVAQRNTWKASAAVHVFVNTVTTVASLARAMASGP